MERRHDIHDAIEFICNERGLEKHFINVVLRYFVRFLQKSMQNRTEVSVHGLGTFSVRGRRVGRHYDPSRGVVVDQRGQSHRCHFAPSKELNRKVKKRFSKNREIVLEEKKQP